MKIFTIICLLAGTSTLLAQSSDWKMLDESRFQIQYPSDWELDQNSTQGTTFILFVKKTEGQVFRTNVNLLIQNLQGTNMDLDAFVKLSEQQISTMLPNYKIVESKRIQSPDQRHSIIFEGDQGSFRLKWKQYYWVVGESAYVLTLTTKSDSYNTIIATGDKILDSFKVKK